MRNIESDQTTADYVNYRKAANLITEADRVFIVGFRTCAGFASSFGVMLGCVRPGIYVVNGSRPLVDSLVDLTKNDTVIGLLSFYNSYTTLVMAMEVLLGLVSKKNKSQNEERLIKMEEYLRETGQY